MKVYELIKKDDTDRFKVAITVYEEDCLVSFLHSQNGIFGFCLKKDMCTRFKKAELRQFLQETLNNL